MRRSILSVSIVSLALIAPVSAQRATPPAVQPIIADAARVLPVRSRGGMVSSQERLATLVGVDVLAPRRQRGRRRGRGRLRAQRHAAARGQSRRRRLHADPPGGGRPHGRDRSSRNRARGRARGHVPRCRGPGRSAALPRHGARGRRAGDGGGPPPRPSDLRLRPDAARCADPSGDPAGPRGRARARRPRGQPAAGGRPARPLPVEPRDLPRSRRARAGGGRAPRPDRSRADAGGRSPHGGRTASTAARSPSGSSRRCARPAAT